MISNTIEILDLSVSADSVSSATERYITDPDNRQRFVVEWTAIEAPTGFQEIGCGIAYIERRWDATDWKADHFRQDISACGDGRYTWYDDTHQSLLLLIVILPRGFVFAESEEQYPIPLMAKNFNGRMAVCWNLTTFDTRAVWRMIRSSEGTIAESCNAVNSRGVAAYKKQLQPRTTPHTSQTVIASASKGTLPFDVFLAHHSEDKPAIIALADQLARHGIRPWLDVEQIAPGTSFQDAIQAAILESRAIAICIGPTGVGRWQALELKAAVSKSINDGIPVIPVLLPGASTIPEPLSFLAEFNWVRFNDSVQELNTIDLLIWGITGRRPGDSGKTINGQQVAAPDLLTSIRQESEVPKPGRSSRVLFTLHGICTHAEWNNKVSQVGFADAWQVRSDRWNFGYFSLLRFLSPWSRSAKVLWFREVYNDETNDRRVLLAKGQSPSIVAHSFGTYILGNALLKYDWLTFNRVVLCGSILPVDFPWDTLLASGRIQAVRNEYGVQDFWSRIVHWFVAGTGPSGQSGFTRHHQRLEQVQFYYEHSEYFDNGHMEANWLPFLDRRDTHIPVVKGSVSRPRSMPPWGLYGVYALIIVAITVATWMIRAAKSNQSQHEQNSEAPNPHTLQPPERQHIRTATFSQASVYDDESRNYSGPTHQGWTVVPESVSFVIESSQGKQEFDWSFSLIATEPMVTYQVKTLHHRVGMSGKITFHFEYDIAR